MKKVFVNGYGSIGSRITKFIKDDPDIDVVGIGKYSSNEKVQHVINDGFSVYVPEDKIDNFKNYDISGSIESVIYPSFSFNLLARFNISNALSILILFSVHE